ncbi:YpjP family protein [Sporosarcina sp. 179-K 3D1 HS]|uniref:YpjP family protein n=1 Tax=Sporosarcina sp. 179-K 3D1 HS TaxID=3232169 RepID=UPI00399FF826
MKKWLQKTLIVTVALLTFGAISPSHEFWTNLQEKDEANPGLHPSRADDFQIAVAERDFEPETIDQPISIEETLVSSAKELSYMKFGSKIGPVIQGEFDEVIFPKIEEAIHMTLANSDDVHKRRLAISERPAGNYSEKIFHVFDMDARKDLIRFHVRTEKRPQEGYYFNFHYHVAHDGFMAHHTIGDIYWSKNTPPKWLS